MHKVSLRKLENSVLKSITAKNGYIKIDANKSGKDYKFLLCVDDFSNGIDTDVIQFSMKDADVAVIHGDISFGVLISKVSPYVRYISNNTVILGLSLYYDDNTQLSIGIPVKSGLTYENIVLFDILDDIDDTEIFQKVFIRNYNNIFKKSFNRGE